MHPDDANPPEHATEDGSATTFATLGLDPRLVAAVEALGFTEPTPIQAAALPPLLAGHDVIGRARTGSGKTAAFGLPLLHRVAAGGAPVRALVLTPTRELALQVTDALRDLAKKIPVRIATIYGGAPYPPQLKALAAGVPVVVGTPGRVLDHLERGSLDLSKLELLVLDEADEMLRMGFYDDVTRVLDAASPDRQIALFSATMPEPIRALATGRMRAPVELQVESSALSVGHIQQTWASVPHRHKLDALVRVLAAAPPGSTLVFARTRQSCADVADALTERGVAVEALHGDLAQSARERVVQRFRAGHVSVVVATDVAARGLDVEHVGLVINLDLPGDTETYVHRIGRTGRAGRPGRALSFVSPAERRKLRFVEKQLGVRIDEARIPTDAEIESARLTRLEADLREALGGDDAPAARARVSAWLASGAWTAEDLAVAALLRLGLPLAPVAEEVPAPTPQAEARARQDEALVDLGLPVVLFLPVGAQRGVRIGDLFEAFVQGAGVPREQLGRITVLPRKSFVGVPSGVADRLLNDVRELNVRGHIVPLTLARPRPDGPTDDEGRGRPRGPRHPKHRPRGFHRDDGR